MKASLRWGARLVLLVAWLIVASPVLADDLQPPGTPLPIRGVDLEITVEAQGSVAPGGLVSYWLSVRNAGSAPVSPVSVVDTLPEGVTFVSASGTDWNCVHDDASREIRCVRSLPLLGDAPPITIEAVAPNQVGTITNVVTVGAPVDDEEPTDNETSVETAIVAEADLSLLMVVDQGDPADAAAPLTYTVRVSNLGPNQAIGVVVEFAPPAAATFLGAAGRDWECEYNREVHRVNCARPSLPAGSTAPDLAITVMAPPEGGAITSNAVVSSLSADANSANNHDSEESTVLPLADLAVTVRRPRFGLPLVYSIVVANDGPSTAEGVSLRARLPVGASLISATPQLPGRAEVDGTFVYDLGNLPPGATTEITLQVYATSLNVTPRVLTVEATSRTRDLDDANNTASQVTVMPWYALYVPIHTNDGMP